MGVVVEARHLQLGQSVAIKLLSVDDSQRTEATTRFLREGRAAAALRSDHVVRIYDVGMLDDGAPFMVMEFLRGLDLATLLDNAGPLPLPDAIEYVSQAASAIAEAHDCGIVHRDLKPSNLFVTQRSSDGAAVIKVLDFGISKSVDPESGLEGNLTETRSVMGSPYYMSPEQVRDAKKVDTRTDVWSLGVILHELLTGEPAFKADTLPGICAAIAADAPSPLRSLRADVPESLEAIVLKCLEKDPARRFQSMRDFAAALAPLRRESQPNTVIDLGMGRSVATREPSGLSNAPTLAVAEADSAVIRGSVDSSVRSVDNPADRTVLSAGSLPARITSASPGRRWPLLAGAAGIAAALAVGVHFVSKSAVVPAPAPPSASAAEAPTAARVFTLFVESVPTGADVFDGERKIGTTPLQVSVLKEQVRREAATFTLRHAGYQPYSLVQGYSDDNVRLVAALVPEAPPATASAAVEAPAPSAVPHKVAPRPHPQKAAAPAPTSDIRMQR